MNIVKKIFNKIIESIINWSNFLWKRRLRIFFVLILPFFFYTFFYFSFIVDQEGVCKITMPAREYQKDLENCSVAMNKELAKSQEDFLSRFFFGITERLKYDLVIRNNIQTENGTSSLMIIRGENSVVKEKLALNEYYTIANNLNRFEVIDKLANYAPELEVWSGTKISGGWEIKYHFDLFSKVILIVIILIGWFQFVQIVDYIFFKRF